MPKVFKLPANTEIISKRRKFKKLTRVAHDIWVQDLELSSNGFDKLIKKFKNHDKHYEGVTGGGLNKDVKDTLDLALHQHPEFMEECSWFQEKVCEGFRAMIALPEFKHLRQKGETVDTLVREMEEHLFIANDGYQMQRYKPKGKYVHHFEQGFHNLRTARRTLVYTFYLNDNFKDGCTHFPRQNVAIQPKKGRLVLFDSSWSNVHAGMEVTEGEKYIVTGWCLGAMQISPEEATEIHMQYEQQQKAQFLEWQRQQHGS